MMNQNQHQRVWERIESELSKEDYGETPMNWNEIIRDFMAAVVLLGMVAANVTLRINGSEVPPILESEELFGVLVGAIVLKEGSAAVRR